MNEYIPVLEERIITLNHLIEKAETALFDAPDGHLRVSRKGEQYCYYRCNDETTNGGKYLSRNQLSEASDLAQKDYNTAFLRSAQKELNAIERFLRALPKSEVEELYPLLSPARKALVDPLIPSDDMFRAKWEAQLYSPLPIPEDVPSFQTEKGEAVRSKSEWIIANLLNQYGIPYHYEMPLALKISSPSSYSSSQKAMVAANERMSITNNCILVHPDFTVLNLSKRKTLYWEHLGMMDSPDYSNKALRKISLYQSNGFFPGENLLITAESSSLPLQIWQIRLIIEHYLL